MIKSHASPDYICPICVGLREEINDNTLIRPSDIVYRDERVTVLINSFFMGKNAGHVIIVPNEHIENIYELPEELGHHIFSVAKKCALAIRTAYDADGITLKQNNEPAGDQHAFHFHLHVFPRYDDDGFTAIQPSQKRLAPPEERQLYAEKLAPVLRDLF